MEQTESLNSIQTVKPSKRRSPLRLLILLVVFIILTIVIGGSLYLTGGVSFLRKAWEVRNCESKGACPANRLLILTKPQQIQGEVGENSSLMTQNVVYIGFWGEEFWTLSLDGPIKKFKQASNTTFGIAVGIDENDLERKNIASKLNSGQLQRVDSQAFNDNKKIFIIEGDPGHLTAEKFRDIVKSGNLLMALYEPTSNELTGLIILDFDR
jgi:hypothetical protein